MVFGILRTFKWSQKFYAPKEYLSDEEQKEKPKSLPRTFWGWLGPVFSAGQDEVIRTAGVDAAMYAHVCSISFPCRKHSSSRSRAGVIDIWHPVWSKGLSRCGPRRATSPCGGAFQFLFRSTCRGNSLLLWLLQVHEDPQIRTLPAAATLSCSWLNHERSRSKLHRHFGTTGCSLRGCPL